MEDTAPQLTVSFVAKALGLSLTGADFPIPVVTTDSRKISPGALFVAVPGEKFDGHDFIATAVDGGARAIICRKDFPTHSAPPAEYLLVDDTVGAYRQLAKTWRAQFHCPVVAVAGSVGKTTTKELLAAALRGKWTDVVATRGSQNGFLGIPMTLLDLRAHHGAAVVEVGIDEIGAMEQHWALVRPTHAVLSALGPEHLEKLIDVATVVREESIIMERTAADGGTTLINLDDEHIAPLAQRFKTGAVIGFGTSARPAPQTLAGRVEGETLIVTGFGTDKGESYSLPLPGSHNARNLLAAITTARSVGLTWDEIREGLATFKGVAGRSQVETLHGGRTTVLCDYYNANPDSMAAGLMTLNELAAARGLKRKCAALADMKETGAEEKALHRALAPLLKDYAVVLLNGRLMKELEAELKARGFKGTLAHFPNAAALGKHIKTLLREGDALIIKGSHSMQMESVWAELK